MSRRARSPTRARSSRHRGDDDADELAPRPSRRAESPQTPTPQPTPQPPRASRELPPAFVPCVLDVKAPVAAGIGANTHVLLAPKVMRAIGCGTGDWVRVRAASAATAGAATLDTPAAGAPRRSGRLKDKAAANSAASYVRGDDDDGGDDGARRTWKSRAASALTLDVSLEDSSIDDYDDDDSLPIGAIEVLARAWPSPTLADDGASLARKVWLSMGCPAGGASLGVARYVPSDDGELDTDARDVHLKLWAMETSVGGEATVWLERGLRADGARGPSRQRGMLEALARRALDGRGLLVGNIVRLPLLGTSALFEVYSVEPGIPSDRITEVSARTKISLHARDGVDASGAETRSGADDDSHDDDDDKDVGAAAAKRASRAATAQNVSFDTLGGVSAHEAALRELVTLPLRSPEVFTRCGVKPPRGVLLHGPPGSGKTRLARAAAHASNASLFVINGPELVSAHLGESEEALRGVFLAAVKSAPSVVLLDELDAIAPARNQASGDDMMSSRIVATMLAIFDGGTASVPELDRVVVIATTNRPDAIERALRRPGRFDRELEVGVPTPSDRLEILRAHLRGINHSLSENYIEALAKSTHGFVGADVAALCQHAAMRALTRVIESTDAVDNDDDADEDINALTRAMQTVVIGAGEGDDAVMKVTMDDFEAARVAVRPSALREVAVEIPNVHWDDVGGLDDVKDRLKEAVEWAEKHPDAMKRVGAAAPKGILLYGPPGCSKTMLARAVASASGRNFISIKGSELFSKYVGDSEKAVRSVFSRARASSPAVIFIDEVDGLAGTRGGGGEGGAPSVQDRVITQLLGEMDGLLPSAAVTVVAATNRPDLVDAALLRPGRFDRLLYVPPPTAAEDREAILRVQLKNTPLADDVDLTMAALATKGYTGADLSAICREAALAALEESLDATEVCARHFATAMSRSRPSPAPRPELLDMYEKFRRQ